MAKCTTPTLYESLRHCVGEKVLPGVRSKCYFISKRDIVKFPKLALPASSTTSAQLSTYEGSFTLVADKKWNVIDLVPNKGNVEFEAQGTAPSITFLNKFTAYVPGIGEKETAFARLSVDDELVFLVQQRNGKYRVLGGEEYPALVKPKGSTGEGTTTNGGLNVEIEATDVCPAPFYTGDILTEEGTIKADTGAVTPATGVGG